MKKILIISASFIVMSCSVNENDLLGKYSFTGDNVIDTLIIKQDTYIHKIYDKHSKLLYQGQDKWELDKNRINLQNFYNNEDNELTEALSNEDSKKFLMLTSYPIDKQNNHIIIEVNADENIRYEKGR